jgi:CheY-like chemotaxis protein
MTLTFTGADNVEIIIADDEDDNLDVAEMSLTLAGYDESKYIKVNCGEDTIEKVKELQSGDPDVPLVVLLDLNMPPKMGGAECATILDKMEGLERPPMLVCCSAGKVADIKAQSYSQHFRYFITKPFTPASAEELLREVEKWVESKQ